MIGSSKSLEFPKSEKDDLSFVSALFQWGGLIKMRKMHKMLTDNTLYIPAKLLTIIGALNWGLVGLLNFNLVAAIFGKKIHSLAAGLHSCGPGWSLLSD